MTGDTEPRRSPAAVQLLENMQAEAGYDVDYPNSVPDMAKLEVLAEFLDKMGARSGPARRQGTIELFGDPMYEAAVKQRIEALTREFKVGDGDIWSRRERLDHRRRLVDLVLSVESAIRKRGRNLPFRPVVGTLPTRHINAQAIPGPRSAGDIVAFETGMFMFTDVLARVVALSLTIPKPFSTGGPVFDKPAVLEHIAAHPGILLDFADLIFSQTYLGTCQYAVKRFIPKGFGLEEIHAWLRHAAETFVLAHEYGHVILGHPGIETPATEAELHRREFEADELGFQLTLAASDDPKWAYAGPVLFLTGSAIGDLASAVRKSGVAKVLNTPTHPSPPERLSKLAEHLSRALAPAEVQAATELAQMIKWLFMDLWNWLQFAFEDAHRNGLTQRLPKYQSRSEGGRVKVNNKPTPFPDEYLYTEKNAYLSWFLANAFGVPEPDPATVTDENVSEVVEQLQQATQAALAADFRRRPHLR